MADAAVLELRALEGFYGESQILQGIDLAVHRGEIVTLVGRNGAGKTTTLRAIMGILRRRRGSVQVMGQETIGFPPEKIARLDFMVQEAQNTLRALQREREVAERIEQGIKSLRASSTPGKIASA